MTNKNEGSKPEKITEKPNLDTTESKNDVFKNFNSDVIGRILLTFLFFLIGWLALWVFGVVVLVQFGFLLVTGELNTNLKAFNAEVGSFLTDIIKYLSFQTDDKPFPFRSWGQDKKDQKTKQAV
ncbi:MAG: DUF4389 domain-containing protein [Proteobacteria bacterium]|nr:DUF4389 domain-containing protein [Pseudomonadota bacterium]